MATSFPFVTGEVLTAGDMNSLTAFDVAADKTNDYTAVLADQYQTLIPMNKGTAVAFKIPTDASVDFAVGTVITVLNKGVGDCTISAVTSGTTTILSAGATAAAPILARYKTAACIKTAANAWYIVGAIA
jgi:hypothetical protein